MSILVDPPAVCKSQPSVMPPRPTALRVNADGIPQELKARQQWVVWQFTWKRREQKWDKPPLQVNGRPAKANDPATWTDFDTAHRAYRRGGFDGIGFVPTADDPFTFLDLDHVVRPDGLGEWTPELRAMFAGDVPSPGAVVTQFDTYAETSPSGTGVRHRVRGEIAGRPPQDRRQGKWLSRRRRNVLSGTLPHADRTETARGPLGGQRADSRTHTAARCGVRAADPYASIHGIVPRPPRSH